MLHLIHGIWAALELDRQREGGGKDGERGRQRHKERKKKKGLQRVFLWKFSCAVCIAEGFRLKKKGQKTFHIISSWG